ncbi:unnamed protein product, partial [marine sediment metagenome]
MNRPDTSWQFDIERAVSTWRRFVSRDPAIRSADLDELEIHLRDAWEDALRRGMSPAEAFEEARDDLGNIAALGAFYGEVHMEKIFRRGQITSELYQLTMPVNHYLKSAWRNIIRHRGYTALNLTGLSMAFAAALIIGLFIRHSLSFDQ